jgi:hypothetical protein
MDEIEELQIELLAHAVAIARHHAGLATVAVGEPGVARV